MSRKMEVFRQMDSTSIALQQIHQIERTLAPLVSQNWHNWEFDSKFFTALSQWTREHPSLFEGVLDGFTGAVSGGGDLLRLITNSSFPAHGLIGALTQLLLLGVSIPRTMHAVQEFARSVMRWVGDLQHTFESSGTAKDTFTTLTWKYLQSVRVLIHEICKWAGARLRDKRWSRVGEGLRSAIEIMEFKARITTARGFLLDLSNAKSIRRSLKMDLFLIFYQERFITREIKEIKKIQSEQLSTNYFDELLAQAQALKRLQSTMKSLSSHTMTNITYQQQGMRACAQGTRVDILSDIEQWIHHIAVGSPNFLWLTGSPGCGKSTIATSIARACEEEGTLWAQLFISRNNINTVNPDRYLPSIARQLAARSETVEQQVHQALKENPSLLDKISVTQAMQLLVNTVGIASKLDPQKPVVVIIDGLDETEHGRLTEIATVLSQLFDALSEYPNVKILISCRPENDIQKPFATLMNNRDVRHIHIDTHNPSSILDVSVYVRSRMAEIARKYDLPSSWPGNETIDIFTARASGLFIWAVTALNVIDERIGRWGKDRLNVLFDALNSKIDIGALYETILHSAYSHETDDSSLESFRRIIGAIAVLQQPLSLSELSDLLDLEQYRPSENNNIQDFVNRLRTILVTGSDPVDMQTVPGLHKSFFDFITSDRVDPRFRIYPQLSHRDLSVHCLRLLSGAYARLGTTPGKHTQSIPTSLPGSFRYAFQFWSSHLELSNPVRARSTGVAIGDAGIDIAEFHKILRFSPNGGLFGPLCILLSPDKSQIQISLEDRHLAWDVVTGQRLDKTCYQKPFEGHKKPLSCVAFSPSGSQVASGSWDNTIIIWDASTGQPVTELIVGHTKTVWSVAFSPNGKQLVSGSWDRTVRLWDAQTGRPIGSPFVGHTNLVSSVAFSPNGKQIISGSWDHTIRLWDLQTGQPIGTPFKGHSDWVWSVAYSPDGRRIVSASHDKTIRIWDAYSGQCVGLPFKGHTHGVTSVAFSPDGSQVVSGSEDKTIRVWDPDTGRPVGAQPLLRLDKRIWSVAFSPPNGRQIAVGCEDGMVYLLDAGETTAGTAKLAGHTGPVYSVAFAPDGNSIASSSGDHTVRIWEVPITPLDNRVSTALSPYGEKAVTISSRASSKNTLRIWDWEASEENVISLLLEGEPKSVSCVAFSSSKTRLAAAAMDGTVYLWDATGRLIDSSSAKDSSPTYPTSPPISLDFAADDMQLVAKFADGCIFALREEARKLIKVTEADLPLIQPEPAFFDIDETPGWMHGYLRWFPSKKRDSSSGLWAYVNNHIIRGRADGSITVVQL